MAADRTGITAIIQARTGSTRLPAKVLRLLAGRTVLEQVIRRVLASRVVDRVVVATTTNPADDPVVDVARRTGVLVTRGDEQDVLARFVQALDEHGGEVVVRVTSDCPCLDPQVLAQVTRAFLAASPPVDYLSNTIARSYPRGLDVEVFGAEALRRAARSASDASAREHVTPHLYRNPALFTSAQYVRDGADASALRVTLDTEEDWEVIEALFDALGDDEPPFGLEQIEAFLAAHPELRLRNAAIEQRAH